MQTPIEIKYNGETYWGFKSPCPSWLKKLYLKAVENKCEECPNTENLEIHRPKRQTENGLYTVVPKGHPLCNWKVLCSKCHEKYNYSRKQPAYTVGGRN